MSRSRTIGPVVALAVSMLVLGLAGAGCGEVDEGSLEDLSAPLALEELLVVDPGIPVDHDDLEPDEDDGDDDDDDDDPECVAGEVEACYEDSHETRGVGACRDGLRTCLDDGSWGPCEDSFGPDDETCNGEDDDCDGVVDEGCCVVAEACEPERQGDFCSDTLVTIVCEAGTDCVCPAGEWCHLQCPDGGCVFRWETGSCATLECASCDCAAVAPPPGEPSAASACWQRLAP